tara:strand:+ start:16 stop:480 length:465 start_codon:yes stop_codon:yes gene_type:complete
MPKQVYTWGKVTAGDIISFRYKGKKPTSTLTTLLVLNPRIPYTRKDKTKTFHLVGLKLEDKGTIPTIKAKPMLVQLLERVGGIQVISGEDKIYRIGIQGTGPRGVRRATYNKIKQYVNKHAVYRTYDYKEAKKSGVFLEPIKLPKSLVEVLVEN